jgi:hypothetical protein
MRPYHLLAAVAAQHAFAANSNSTSSLTRPSNTSICDYYSTRLYGANTAKNQAGLVILLVNTVVAGNYTTLYNVASNTSVPGILAAGAEYNNTPVDLLPYFNGQLQSSNRGGTEGVAVNFLDDGGASPLKQNKPAMGTGSNQ